MSLTLLLFVSSVSAQFSVHVGDIHPIFDPMRPVCEITQDAFVLQYFTQAPCETRVQIREGGVAMGAGHALSKVDNPYINAREVSLLSGKRTFHRVRVENLKPGTRYYYRVYDPGSSPTVEEEGWGASVPWRREYAVSTLAPKGKKTIIHLPVKVLLMPNVINVASAHSDQGVIAVEPQRMSSADIEKVKEEFAKASLFFWINSGMRLWVDWHFFVDDRWQRWGDEPSHAVSFYRSWVMCRSYGGQDYLGPGGGTFTILDTQNPLNARSEPVKENAPYAGQIEVAFPRKWNDKEKKWEFYGSGGGTFGIDGFPRGFPGRSQYLGGGDIAWLTCHEFHHQLESYSAFFLSFREDERIVFNHYEPRKRVTKEDGTEHEMTWNTSGRHGEHWAGMAFFDRQLSDAQWLRFLFGETITVVDEDGDGFPDADSRLPLDELRFGSSPKKFKTDDNITDLQKVMLSDWVPNPLQSTWVKPAPQYFSFVPVRADSDGDGWTDDIDPYPLIPFAPFIYPLSPDVDGDDEEWGELPLAGLLEVDPLKLSFKQSHDEYYYYGLLRVFGDWKTINVALDGEGHGLFSQISILGFDVIRENNGDIKMRPTWGGAPGLEWKAVTTQDKQTIFEFRIPNRGVSPWFWMRGGREIGVQINVYTSKGSGYALWSPYTVFYARMIEHYGRVKPPSGGPLPVEPGPGVTVLKPGDAKVEVGSSWKIEDAIWKHSGTASHLVIQIPETVGFDFWVRIRARQDGVLGAFRRQTVNLDAGQDYIAFVGGYGNSRTRFRLFGRELGSGVEMMKETDWRTIQLSRRAGQVWLLVDGKVELFEQDPNRFAKVNRLVVMGGWDGRQMVSEIRYRVIADQ